MSKPTKVDQTRVQEVKRKLMELAPEDKMPATPRADTPTEAKPVSLADRVAEMETDNKLLIDLIINHAMNLRNTSDALLAAVQKRN